MSANTTTKHVKKNTHAETIPSGTAVTYHYRSAIGHGTVTGVYKKGLTPSTTEYSIEEHDHHPGEKSVVHHYGSALTRA